ncbi:hypothetical protein J6590_067756 [Homalodisca vitripennis]|nr:hypothetical protein J6590_067756 [Homalodisca vitripennis]
MNSPALGQNDGLAVMVVGGGRGTLVTSENYLFIQRPPRLAFTINYSEKVPGPHRYAHTGV